MRFRTTIVQSGKNTTGIEVPPEVVEALGAGKRPKVKVTIGDYTYRSSLASMGGVPMVSLSAENRAGAGVAGGDEVEVELAVDLEERTVTVPPDLAAAIDAVPAARATFDRLSYSNQSWHVLQVEGAKADETRQRRIAKSVDALAAGLPR
ncbi:MAG TPA: YdeI/OmpD-associated family protein [Acidimicrobiia bacterium]|nr:YdeI/OmpD-associated family protein [Acidimicrobiia bacterium]